MLAIERRVEDERKSWRLVYAVEPDAIVVLEVFEKRTQKTPKHVIDSCSDRLTRYRAMLGGVGLMKASKRAALERAGWTVGSTEEFLELSAEERAFVDVKLALAQALRMRRERKKLTQAQVARLLGSSQPRVAMMEAGDSSVTMDLLVRSLFAIGATPKDLAKVLAGRR